MAYEMRTVSVDLGDGDQAEMFAELKHKTQRLIQDITKKFLKMPDSKIRVSLDGGTDKPEVKLTLGKEPVAPADVVAQVEKAVGEIEIDLENADFTTATDVMILSQVKSWSFGNVNQDTLDNISEAKREIMAKKCDELYKGALIPFPVSGGQN